MGKSSWRKRIKKNSRMVFGIAGFVALVVLMGISAWGVRSQKNVTTKAAALKSTCTGSWTCTKGTQSFTYQCSNYAGGTEALCTGGGNGQGNYCTSGYTRSNGCTYSTGPTPTPTSTPTSKPTTSTPTRTPTPTPTPKSFKCSANSYNCANKSLGSSCYLDGYLKSSTCLASPDSKDPNLCYCPHPICVSDKECNNDYFCQSGSCVKQYSALGTACDRNRQCQSGHCRKDASRNFKKVCSAI